MALVNLLDPIFDPLLYLNPGLAIFTVAFLVTVLITVVYKYTTDQKMMKELKQSLKDMQKKMREVAKKDPQKAMGMQSQAMKKNFEYMKHSFKATLYTLIPVLFIFIWMSANFVYHPIVPGQEFTLTAEFASGHANNITLTTIPEMTIKGDGGEKTQKIIFDEKTRAGMAIWTLSAPAEGEYQLQLDYNNELYDHKILVTKGKKYSNPEKLVQDSKLVGNEKVYPFTVFGLKINWLWAYIIISIVLSILLRKIMKVY
jgi:uncharacterized membrane protein (DUF106 family)